jgi:plasmid stability protein
MSKRRITVNLDEDVVAALEAAAGRSVSAVANAVLREGLAIHAHRAALLRWLDQLNAEHGEPTEQDLAAADRLLDAAERGEDGASSAA